MSEWQPIETAPKNGRIIQLWGDEDWTPEAYWCKQRERWCSEYWDADFSCYSVSVVFGVTHWMPLPAPPENK